MVNLNFKNKKYYKFLFFLFLFLFILMVFINFISLKKPTYKIQQLRKTKIKITNILKDGETIYLTLIVDNESDFNVVLSFYDLDIIFYKNGKVIQIKRSVNYDVNVGVDKHKVLYYKIRVENCNFNYSKIVIKGKASYQFPLLAKFTKYRIKREIYYEKVYDK